MKHIEVAVLNPEAIREAKKLMVCGARLTQRGHKIHSMADLQTLYSRSYSETLVGRLTGLPHPTIQKLTTITVGVVGASRRFLAQITRHQNEVKFISASLQYSDYSEQADFVIPYEIFSKGEAAVHHYLAVCQETMKEYNLFAGQVGVGNDAAGYVSPQALRSVLLISATPYQWKHMIGQRICRRNTPETRYVMLRVWQQLYDLSPTFFSSEATGSFCMKDGHCPEGDMSCGKCIETHQTPVKILLEDFPLLYEE